MKLVVATGNPHKLEEFRRILSHLNVEILSPADAGADCEVEETGTTFAENARIKAQYVYQKTGLTAVADDSGLCVDALDGRPGVYSSRYQGEDTGYDTKMAAILKELEQMPQENRTARFLCAICCILEDGTELACEGACEGSIAFQPSGVGGFGYDPIFQVDGRSFADLTGEEKDAVSHRGAALRRFSGLLGEYFQRKENV